MIFGWPASTAGEVTDVVLHFTLDAKPGYRVAIAESGKPGERHHWQISAEWPGGSATRMETEKPGW